MAERTAFEAATAKQQSLQPAAWAAPVPCVLPVPCAQWAACPNWTDADANPSHCAMAAYPRNGMATDSISVKINVRVRESLMAARNIPPATRQYTPLRAILG
jgi:hypothetical protein